MRLHDRADACRGHYCIERELADLPGYREFWNAESKRWTSAGTVYSNIYSAASALGDVATAELARLSAEVEAAKKAMAEMAGQAKDAGVQIGALTVERDKYSAELDCAAAILQTETAMGRAGQGVGLLVVAHFVEMLVHERNEAVLERDRLSAACQRLADLYRGAREWWWAVSYEETGHWEVWNQHTEWRIAAAMKGGDDETRQAEPKQVHRGTDTSGAAAEEAKGEAEAVKTTAGQQFIADWMVNPKFHGNDSPPPQPDLASQLAEAKDREQNIFDSIQPTIEERDTLRKQLHATRQQLTDLRAHCEMLQQTVRNDEQAMRRAVEGWEEERKELVQQLRESHAEASSIGMMYSEMKRNYEETAAKLAEARKRTAVMDSLVQCCECEGWFPLTQLEPSSAHPEAQPICRRCIELSEVKEQASGEYIRGQTEEQRARATVENSHIASLVQQLASARAACERLKEAFRRTRQHEAYGQSWWSTAERTRKWWLDNWNRTTESIIAAAMGQPDDKTPPVIGGTVTCTLDAGRFEEAKADTLSEEERDIVESMRGSERGDVRLLLAIIDRIAPKGEGK